MKGRRSVWKVRSSDEHFGFAPNTVKREPQPPAEDPGSYADSWYQVLKGKAEEEVADEAHDGYV